jgi:hypothetical protein
LAICGAQGDRIYRSDEADLAFFLPGLKQSEEIKGGDGAANGTERRCDVCSDVGDWMMNGTYRGQRISVAIDPLQTWAFDNCCYAA